MPYEVIRLLALSSYLAFPPHDYDFSILVWKFARGEIEGC